MGDSLPVADNTSEAGRTLNRRVELYLVTEAPGSKGNLTVTIPSSPNQSVTVTGAVATGHREECVTQEKNPLQNESGICLL